MDGGNLREGIMEVAFEQWIERTKVLVDFNVFPTLQGNNIGMKSCIGRVQRGNSLKLGGNTDEYSP